MALGLGGVVGVFSGGWSRRPVVTGHGHEHERVQEMEALRTEDDYNLEKWMKLFSK